MFNIFSHQGNAIQKLLWDTILYLSMVKINNISDISCWWVGEQSSISGNCKNLHKHLGNQNSSSQNWELKAQLYHYWAYTQRAHYITTKTLV